MKRSVFILAVSFILSWAAAVAAGPIAPMLPLKDYGKKAFAAEGKTIADVEKQLPTAEQVSLPAYPDSRYGMSGKSNGVLSSLQLLSKDSPDKVIAWYKEKLGAGWLYAPNVANAVLGEVGVFVKTDKKQVDAFDLMKTIYITLSKIEKEGDTGFIEMMFDVSGYKTIITYSLKPLM